MSSCSLLVLAGVFADVINDALHIAGTSEGPYALDNVTATDFDGLPIIGPAAGSSSPGTTRSASRPAPAYDNLARLLLGLRTSLLIATLATVISTIVGVVVGLLAGFSRGWLDRIISFVIDVFLSFPFILGALTVAPILVDRFGQNADTLAYAQMLALIGILVIFGWMGLARLIRGPGAVAARARVHPGRPGDRRTDPADPVQGAAAQPGRADRDRHLARPARPSSPPRPVCRSSASA